MSEQGIYRVINCENAEKIYKETLLAGDSMYHKDFFSSACNRYYYWFLHKSYWILNKKNIQVTKKYTHECIRTNISKVISNTLVSALRGSLSLTQETKTNLFQLNTNIDTLAEYRKKADYSNAIITKEDAKDVKNIRDEIDECLSYLFK